MQISPAVMEDDVAQIYEQQKAIGYESELIVGAAESDKYMKGMFHDWRARGITSVLHEKKGGFANNMASMLGLAAKAEGAGVTIHSGVEVTGFQYTDAGITAVETNRGPIRTDYVVVGVGPWVKHIWEMLDLPKTITVNDNGTMHENVRMWRYWCLQEGTLNVDPDLQRTNDGESPPVVHIDTDAPLYSDVDGSLITDEMWGIYYKPDFSFGGIQGGAMPYKVEKDPDEVAVDPYGPKSPDFIVGEDFANMWCSALAFCQERFAGKFDLFRGDEPSGGIGSFTADSFPVFDVFRGNCYFVADSNHGYKMLGVGKLVAEEIVGSRSALLEPFRFSRYAEGKLHPVSNSPYPWS
jgi:glycine/D-amino acid oxidase-like deaminating enzyme